jgi:cytochrome c oxidase cbb3-type subunit 3/ubiquinol-cytochrome c reductase cytochrome c subunit
MRVESRNWRLLLIVAAMLSGCDLPGQPKTADRPWSGDQVADFDTLYKTRCAGCHGADGRLGPAPPHNDPLFLAIVPDAELLRVIREGRRVTPDQKSPMPAFAVEEGRSLSSAQAKAWAELKKEFHAAPKVQGPLTEAEIQVLAGGIKKRWGPPASLTGSVPPYLAPAGSTANKDEGGRVFARACAGCHGKEGQGIEKDGRLRRKINDSAFLALISDQALRRYAITGRPDFGMPPYDGKDDRPPDFQPLTSQEISNLVALLAHWRQAGTGK